MPLRKPEAVSKSVQVTSQKKESERRRSSDKSTDLNEKEQYSRGKFCRRRAQQRTRGPKTGGDQDFVSHPTQPSSLPPECFGQRTSDPKVFHSLGQTHFYSKEEQEVIEQAPAWAKLMFKE